MFTNFISHFLQLKPSKLNPLSNFLFIISLFEESSRVTNKVVHHPTPYLSSHTDECSTAHESALDLLFSANPFDMMSLQCPTYCEDLKRVRLTIYNVIPKSHVCTTSAFELVICDDMGFNCVDTHQDSVYGRSIVTTGTSIV
jgi:hypothetical protein